MALKIVNSSIITAEYFVLCSNYEFKHHVPVLL